MDELGSILSPLFTIVGVLLGWILANRTQRNMLKVSEIRNELEKAYGTLYSILSKPEEMVEVKEGSELRVVVSGEEKKELDRIFMSYPHMFPIEIVVLWRTEIRNLQPKITFLGRRGGEIATEMHFAIPVKFKNEITKEYEQRLEEYYKITGRWKRLKRLPKWARA